MSDLKMPDTFCFIFSFRIPLSLALLSGGIAGFSGAPDKPCGVGRADANPKLLLNDT